MQATHHGKTSGLNRRTLLAAGLGTAALGVAPAFAAKPFPDRYITLVVPFPPGGMFDSVLRVLCNEAANDLGQPVVLNFNSGLLEYTSVLYGAGAIGVGEGSPAVPVEVERHPDQGNGGGVEVLYTRKTNLIHPFGYAFTSAAVAGISPTIAELKLATNWTRVFTERKQVPIAFLVTN